MKLLEAVSRSFHLLAYLTFTASEKKAQSWSKYFGILRFSTGPIRHNEDGT